MLFSELCKIMVNEVTSVGFRGVGLPNRSLGSAADCRHYLFLQKLRSFDSKYGNCFSTTLRRAFYDTKTSFQ